MDDWQGALEALEALGRAAAEKKLQRAQSAPTGPLYQIPTTPIIVPSEEAVEEPEVRRRGRKKGGKNRTPKKTASKAVHAHKDPSTPNQNTPLGLGNASSEQERPRSAPKAVAELSGEISLLSPAARPSARHEPHLAWKSHQSPIVYSVLSSTISSATAVPRKTTRQSVASLPSSYLLPPLLDLPHIEVGSPLTLKEHQKNASVLTREEGEVLWAHQQISRRYSLPSAAARSNPRAEEGNERLENEMDVDEEEEASVPQGGNKRRRRSAHAKLLESSARYLARRQDETVLEGEELQNPNKSAAKGKRGAAKKTAKRTAKKSAKKTTAAAKKTTAELDIESVDSEDEEAYWMHMHDPTESASETALRMNAREARRAAKKAAASAKKTAGSAKKTAVAKKSASLAKASAGLAKETRETRRVTSVRSPPVLRSHRDVSPPRRPRGRPPKSKKNMKNGVQPQTAKERRKLEAKRLGATPRAKRAAAKEPNIALPTPKMRKRSRKAKEEAEAESSAMQEDEEEEMERPRRKRTPYDPFLHTRTRRSTITKQDTITKQKKLKEARTKEPEEEEEWQKEEHELEPEEEAWEEPEQAEDEQEEEEQAEEEAEQEEEALENEDEEEEEEEEALEEQNEEEEVEEDYHEENREEEEELENEEAQDEAQGRPKRDKFNRISKLHQQMSEELKKIPAMRKLLVPRPTKTEREAIERRQRRVEKQKQKEELFRLELERKTKRKEALLNSAAALRKQRRLALNASKAAAAAEAASKGAGKLAPVTRNANKMSNTAPKKLEYTTIDMNIVAPLVGKKTGLAPKMRAKKASAKKK